MESFLPLLLNVSFPLNWVWLSEQIIANKPYTVRLQCEEESAINSLLRMLGRNVIPWSVHKDVATLPPALYWDMTIILSDNDTYLNNAIGVAAETVRSAYRSRYLAVHLGYIEDSVIHELANFAWIKGLRQISVARLADRSVFVAKPHCHLPRIKQVATVLWSELEKLNLSNCTLTAGTAAGGGAQPFYLARFGEMLGLYAPAFKFVQSGLKFDVSFVEMSMQSINHFALVGKLPVDMVLLPFTISSAPIEMVATWRATIGWCVPKVCVLRSTTYLLWQEFSDYVWILIMVSTLIVSIALTLTSPPPRLSLGDSFIRVIPALTSGGANLPGGHARWTLSGWLWATLVLSTCYQSILHSMMTAPTRGLLVEDLDGLSKSDLDLLAQGSHYTRVQWDGPTSGTLATIAKRTQQVGILNPGESRPPFAIITEDLICSTILRDMTPLPDYVLFESRRGYLGLSAGSWLAPAFHRNFHLMEASGYAGRWINTISTIKTCSYESDGAKPIALVVLWPSFLLMSGGLSLALLSFIAELLLARWKKKKEHPAQT